MHYWQEKVKIGDLEFPRFIGGPLDNVTDSPFRQLVREFSKDNLLYTEMRHVGCVSHDTAEQRALNFKQTERPLNFQISANSVSYIPEACEKIIKKGVDCIDLNVGCPARSVVKNGSGSALMANPENLKQIITTIKKNVSIPVTVKIRAGYKQKNALEIAHLIQDCGADALAIHPRLQTQKFTGRPDYALVAEIKKQLSIPILLSGGIVNWKTAQMAYNKTGVDGYLIGRGLWSKPWKLFELEQHAAGKEFKVDLKTVMQYALKHLDLMLEAYGLHGLFAFRRHLAVYLRGFQNASAIRQKLMRVESIDEVKNELLACSENG